MPPQTTGRILPLPCAEVAALIHAAEPTPSAAEFLAQAERCRRILHESLVDFYLPACVDRMNGGYFEMLRGGSFAPFGEKCLVLQARQLWFFSTLAREGVRREAALAAATAGWDFLENRMRDRSNGGYCAKVTDAGQPRDTRKHVYANAFALYALVAYHRAAGEARALTAARDLSGTLEEKAHDREHGGCTEFFADPCTLGLNVTKSYNTHLHLLESLADLYRVWPDPLVREWLVEALLVINTRTVRHAGHACNIEAWKPNWQPLDCPRNLRASYGHGLECLWLALDATRKLGFSPELFRGWAEGLSANLLAFGYDRRHGGFYHSGPPGRPADRTRKEWWVQAEALVAMLEMYRLTDKPDYYDTFRRTLDFIEQYRIAPEGGWWASRRADGSARGERRTSPWQGAYHNGRALLLLSTHLLEGLAGTGAGHGRDLPLPRAENDCGDLPDGLSWSY